MKEVEAMRQYEEDVDNLNEVAHNRPRAHLVLGKYVPVPDLTLVFRIRIQPSQWFWIQIRNSDPDPGTGSFFLNR